MNAIKARVLAEGIDRIYKRNAAMSLLIMFVLSAVLAAGLEFWAYQTAITVSGWWQQTLIVFAYATIWRMLRLAFEVVTG